MSSWDSFNRRASTDGDHLAQHVPQTDLPTLATLPASVVIRAQGYVWRRWSDDPAILGALLEEAGILGWWRQRMEEWG